MRLLQNMNMPAKLMLLTLVNVVAGLVVGLNRKFRALDRPALQ